MARKAAAVKSPVKRRIKKPALPNLLIAGENLLVLQQLAADERFRGKIDLVYIDPPFASNQVFTMSKHRVRTISRSGTRKAYSDKLNREAFLEFLRARLEVLRELLSENGSIYVHTDYKIGHYVKVMMDDIFGEENFRNDITRIKCNPKNFERKGYGNIKDLILFYSRSASPIWNEPHLPFDETQNKRYNKKEPDGRRYTTVPLHAPGETRNGATSEAFNGLLPPEGRHWRSAAKTLEKLDKAGLIAWSANGVPRKKIYLDEQKGKRVQDVWEWKDPQYPVYPTEKNSDLLAFIIRTSSNKNSIVLDCFCGSGTTLAAAEREGRKWIGIDQSQEALKVVKKKLKAEKFITVKISNRKLKF